MIDFIIKLEDMLRKSGYETWNIYYFPDRENECILEMDGNTILMTKLDEYHPLECPNCKVKLKGEIVMKKIDEILEILKRDLREYNKENAELSDMVWNLKMENAMLKKDNDTYKRALEKESDTEIIKYKGNLYRISNRILSSSPRELDCLSLDCVELYDKKED